jgi:hypothetical protein
LKTFKKIVMIILPRTTIEEAITEGAWYENPSTAG